MIKMFVSDLDGTLLNKWHASDKEINDGVKEVVQRGYLMTVATGRYLRRHQRLGLGFLKNIHYFITMNGALVYDQTGKTIHQLPIASQEIKSLLDHFPEISFEFVTVNEIMVVEGPGQHFIKGFKGQVTGKNIGRAVLNLLLGGFQYRKAISEILEKKVLKIECITNRQMDKLALIDYLESRQNHLSYAYNDGVHFEITAIGANKREGLLHLLRYLSMHPDQVAVYGNDTNDVEMLDYFMHSYVPQNAKVPAKAVAKHEINDPQQPQVIRHILDTVRTQDAYRPSN